MHASLVALFTLACVSVAVAAIKTQEVRYNAGETELKGVLVYNDVIAGKTPGVIIFPEWWGANDYVKARARMLAQLGYIAFVADMYGGGKTTADPKEAGALAQSVYSDPATLKARALAAYEALKTSDRADNGRIAAIGYCMGGNVALNLARSGVDLQAVVAFHAGLVNRLKDPKPITAHVLVCNGADDKMITQEEFGAFEAEMRQTKVDWQYMLYGNAMHAFTNPAADKYRDLGTLGYNQLADERSWRLMRDHLASSLNFRTPAEAVQGQPLPK